MAVEMVLVVMIMKLQNAISKTKRGTMTELG